MQFSGVKRARVTVPLRTVYAKRVGKRSLRIAKWTRGLASKSGLKAMLNKTYRFKRTVVIQGAIRSGVNTAAPGGGTVAMSFSLGQINYQRSEQGGAVQIFNVPVPAASELTALFQQWKIDKVVIKAVPSRNSADYQAGIPVNPGFPTFTTLLSVIDYDDNDTPLTVTPLQEHGDCRIDMMDRIKTYTLRPKFNAVVAAAPGTTSVGPPMRGFLDCAQPNIEHNGIKFSIIAEQARTVDLYVDIFYVMRGSK